jgi:hypothetical protein
MKSFAVFSCILWMTCAAACAQFAHIWHSPADASEVPGGVSMRDPVQPGAGAAATFYQGVWKGEGANQTGGTFHYRVNEGAWQSQALAFHADTAHSLQFWKASQTMPVSAGSTVDYYFHVTFSNRDHTYLHANNSKNLSETTARNSPYRFTVGATSGSGQASLEVNGRDANYHKLNYYIDEAADSSFPEIELVLRPGVADVTHAEIFTNLNRREHAALDANGDGIEDGILPPDGSAISAGDPAGYFRAHPMSDQGDGSFTLTLPVLQTGAFRLTARYRTGADSPWNWIGDQGIRDLAIIVAPRAARDMRVYELHVSNANATGPGFHQRGTFEDLHDPAKRVQLGWLQNLGLNWIWFQPFHPQGLEGRQTDPDTGMDYDPGSPYSIRDFWQINPLYTRAYNPGLPNPVAHPDNYAAAMAAFQGFAQAADSAGVQLMLDFPFNHTAPDVVLGTKGVEIFAAPGNPANWQPNDRIRDRVPRFFSTNGSEGPAAYSAPAQSAAALAVAPDRNDFGKWDDVRDVYFGNYSTLVTGYPDADTSRAIVRNEDDRMFYGSMGPETIGVWRYFGEVLPYWIVRSGHRGSNSTPADGTLAARRAIDAAGIDGLRKDFGQGLPPQAMEYIINRTHSVKWNFVFMSESLDGGEITYRSSRHFAVLNENIVFPLKNATTASAYRNIFEERRSAYGESLVLLNNTSHDEEPYADPWQALIRYAAGSTVDGAPMIMYGQEIGAGQRFQGSQPQGAFDFYELNFGKYIPHFKKWNSMQPQWNAWDANSLGVQHLLPVYSGIGQARAFSPALRSINRWFLNRHADDAVRPSIHAVAKYTQSGSSPAVQDAVLAFLNLDRNLGQSDTFGIPDTLAGHLGLQNNRLYNVRNIAAYTGRSNEFASRRDAWQWPSPRSGQDIREQGVFVSLHPVPASEAAWNSQPYEAQFLKLYDVTPPPGPSGLAVEGLLHGTALADAPTLRWQAAEDPAGGVSGYRLQVGSAPGLADWFDGVVTSPEYSLADLPAGTNLHFRVAQINAAGIEGPATSSAGPVFLLDPAGDDDGDGQSNAAEHLAGTHPLDPASRLHISAVRIDAGQLRITLASVPGKTYELLSSASPAGPWLPVAQDPSATATAETLEWLQPIAAGENRRFFRARLVIPP